MEESKQKQVWYDRNYKILMFIPVVIVILSLVYLGFYYNETGSLFKRDVSLSGGTTITLTNADSLDLVNLESQLKSQYDDINFRKLSDLRSGKVIAFSIESEAKPEELTKSIETILGFKLDDKNSSTEFTGSSLSGDFYKQLLFALFLSFVLMSIVILILFRTLIPSLAVIFAAFSDIVIPLAILDYFGMRISSAGIAAFLMLIGYSVDTDILLTTRAIKNQEGFVNQRIFRAFKLGILMTLTALFAIIPAFFIVTGLPDSFRQIFLILGMGLTADIFNTWLTNAGIIKWYCAKKNIQ